MGERSRELIILVLGDIVVFNLALWVTLFVRYFELPSGERLAAHMTPFLLLSAVWIFSFFIGGLYDKHTVFLKKLLLVRIWYAQIINVALAAIVFIVVPFGIAPKTNLVIYLFVSLMLMMAWRLYVYNFFSPKQRHKAILIADGTEAIELVDEINNNDRYNYKFVRITDESTLASTKDLEFKILSLVEEENIEIIVANPQGKHIEGFLPVLFDLAFLHFTFTFIDFNRLYEDTFDRVPVSSLRYDWFITQVSQSTSIIYDATKRVIDVTGALILMIPAAAIFPFAYIAIKLEDKGPIFYTTERIGQFNKVITIYKLRTKTGRDSGAEALKSELVDTKVGAFLRKTRIDELPQLINVLKGDQSFIGPRPEMPALAKVYAEQIPYYNARHFMKPGLSGWAQINNFDVPRGGIDIERTKSKLSYDLYYLKRRSLLLDIQIGVKTLSTLIMRTGT